VKCGYSIAHHLTSLVCEGCVIVYSVRQVVAVVLQCVVLCKLQWTTSWLLNIELLSYYRILSAITCMNMFNMMSQYLLFTLWLNSWEELWIFLFDYNLYMIFTARCYAKRCICRHAVLVRLFGHLSVMFVDHVKTNKCIFETFSPSGSHTTLVFPHRTWWRYSDGNSPNKGVECKGGMKKWLFSINILLYLRNTYI